MKISLFLLLFLFFSCEKIVQQHDFKNNMLHIIVTKQLVDYESPWLKLPAENQSFVGVVVSKDLVLTTSYAVQNNQLIQLQQMGEAKKWQTQILWEDREINLALVRIPQELQEKVTVFSRSNSSIKVDEKVSILVVLAEDRYTKVPARILNFDISQVHTSTYDLLSYELETQKKGLGWSEPVIYNNKLIGIVSGQESDAVSVIPVQVIERFLSDQHEKENYKGFSGIGINGSGVRGPAFASKYGFDVSKAGFLVSDVNPDSDFYDKIKPKDLLIGVDGYIMNSSSKIEHAKYGDISLGYLLNLKVPGQKVGIQLLRNKKNLTVEGKAYKYSSNSGKIPYFSKDNKPDYLIFGGYVFQELHREFLKSWGSNWSASAPLNLLFAYAYGNDFNDLPKDKSINKDVLEERIVVLNKVLADESNRGYQHLSSAIVARVNGQSIKNLDQMKSVITSQSIASGSEQFTVIELKDGKGEVIISNSNINAVNQRISKQFNIAQ